MGSLENGENGEKDENDENGEKDENDENGENGENSEIRENRENGDQLSLLRRRGYTRINYDLNCFLPVLSRPREKLGSQ